MSGYEYILLDKDPKEHIPTLTFNRPDRRNALNDLMQDEIGDAIEQVEADRSMRVMVLTGSGSVFCAGGDLEAEEAHQMGFLNRLVPEEESESTTMEVARKIAAGRP